MTVSTNVTANRVNQARATRCALPVFLVIFMEAYFTLLQSASSEFIEKKSHFLGYAAPADTEEKAVAFIQEIKKRHWDATHNVSAYCLRERQIKRYSDDGEPKGTAGIPVLDVIDKMNLTDCVVVVTRYFGGVLLGAGGLVRAYSHGCKIALQAAGIAVMTPCTHGLLQCSYSFYETFLKLAQCADVQLYDSQFTNQVQLKFYMITNQFKPFQDAIVEASNGKFHVFPVSESYEKIEKEPD